jgi:thiol-disulfide isomerase/thioredoxin
MRTLTRLLVLLVLPVVTFAQQRKPAPNFVLRDAKGAEVQLADFKGKVLLLDFWATWCGGCKQEIPWFIEFDGKYRDKGLASLGVAMDDEGWQTVKPYLAEHPISYPIVVANADTARGYGITNLPVTLLIDREGRIADMHVGVVGKDAWEQRIRQLLLER